MLARFNEHEEKKSNYNSLKFKIDIIYNIYKKVYKRNNIIVV